MVLKDPRTSTLSHQNPLAGGHRTRAPPLAADDHPLDHLPPIPDHQKVRRDLLLLFPNLPLDPRAGPRRDLQRRAFPVPARDLF